MDWLCKNTVGMVIYKKNVFIHNKFTKIVEKNKKNTF